MATVAVETAQRLFHGMITSVFRAPVSFFDTTPSSRILSRSSTDQSTVDTDIPYRLAGLVFALIQLLSIIVLMSQAAWQVILLFFVVLAISVWYQVLSKCHLAEIVQQDPRLLDAPGTIAEYDKPSQLLQDSSSSFSKLVSEFLRRSSQSNS
ncbi:hypothetical protein TSUD_68030 [Trifolium subterraneum]|uniref:ABC transmembrane type-1 domain-containing protein n=1 Tax=Trifolium subterraneum TaxID=3900 RepID=A0A2Z6MEF4_TRISU|nr:hypothetical protein TSUD_68030 [Trifolium subterraneum]